jgi:hypothetical protein
MHTGAILTMGIMVEVMETGIEPTTGIQPKISTPLPNQQKGKKGIWSKKEKKPEEKSWGANRSKKTSDKSGHSS